MTNTDTQSKPTSNRIDIHQQVTNTIIKQLEEGTVPWHQPWIGKSPALLKLPKNVVSGNQYQGVNILLLWSAAINNNYTAPEWASFKQWNEKKEAIRKGEKGTMIVYYDTFEKEVNGELKKIPYIKSSVVFNRAQLVSYTPEPVETYIIDKPLFEIIEPVEAFIANTKTIIEHHGDRACYVPSADKICMPHPEQFITTATCTATEGYYSTLIHELTHWTGNEKRLNRAGGKKFGDQHYAQEELVAELGAAFLCAEFGMTTAEKGDHAAYIDHWLKVLRENNRCIVSAASEASRAVAFMQGLQKPVM